MCSTACGAKTVTHSTIKSFQSLRSFKLKHQHSEHTSFSSLLTYQSLNKPGLISQVNYFHCNNMANSKQTVFGKLYSSKDPSIKYAAEHSLNLHPVQEKLIEQTLPKGRGMMLGSPDEINFLQLLCQSIGAKKTLDVGVYTGYSALSIALVLPEDGKLVALDIDDENVLQYGAPAWKEAGVDKKIEFIKGSAVESLQKLLDRGEAGTYDFAFVDADKENYDNYYELSLKLLRKNGVIAFDNMLWGGSVYKEENNQPSTVALRNLAKKAHSDPRVKVSLLAIGDGTLFVTKL